MAGLLCLGTGGISRCVWRQVLCAGGILLAVLPLMAGLAEGLAAYRNGNYQLALREFLAEAGKGDGTAMVTIGFMYLRGEGVPADPKEAANWLQQAAERGVAPAQHSLALLYYEGRGVERNAAIAANYFESAALQGLADAQYNLGVLYSRGDGVKQDWTLSRFWHQKAAEQGLTDAQLAIGAMAALGHGGPKDYQQAASWFGRAAASGDQRAQRLLETAFSDLAGVALPQRHTDEQDEQQELLAAETEEAEAGGGAASQAKVPPGVSGAGPGHRLPAAPRDGRFWEHPPQALTERAFRDLQGHAAAGDAEAQILLGWHYLHGVNAPESLIRSYVWAVRGARKGHPDGPLVVRGVEARMSARQLAIAKTILDPPQE